MKTRFLIVSLIAIGIQSAQISLTAHHATAAEFDTSRTVTLKGIVSKLDWANPHVHAYVDVKTDRGATEQWDVELASPGGVIVSGLSRELLQPGTTLTLTGYPAKANVSPNSSDAPSTPSKLPSVCATQIFVNGMTASFVVGI